MFFQNSKWIFIEHREFSRVMHKFLLNNPAKQKAIAMRMWGADKLPDYIKCYKEIKHEWLVKVPLGIAWFIDIDRDNAGNIPVVSIPEFIWVTPYDYQKEAIASLIRKPYGLLHATTGSGKTIMAIMLAQFYQTRTLIVVKDKTLLKQFVVDIQTMLGITPNYCGWTMTKKYKDSINTDVIELTTIQSAEKVDTKRYWLIILDEVHTYLWSDKRREWVGNLTCQYMYGLTWTPVINDVDSRVFNIYIWPSTVCNITNVTPDYCQIYSEFEYYLDDIKKFHELKAELYNDQLRNNLIVDTVCDTIGQSKWLIFTDHVNHAKLLQEELNKRWIETHILIGEVHQDERKRITEYVKEAKGPQVIVGSVQIIWTGFNLPELSRAYLTTTTRFKWDLLQYIGRIIRPHPTKPQPIFYDFVDINTSILESQSNSRVKEFKKAFPKGKITQSINSINF